MADRADTGEENMGIVLRVIENEMASKYIKIKI